MVPLMLAAMLSPGAAAAPPLQGPTEVMVEPSPGTPQVIAHGVMTLPAGDLVWTLAEGRTAPNDGRAQASSFGPDFILGRDEAVLIADAQGRVLTRVAPGDAAWIPEDLETVVVGTGAAQAGYTPISLRPADGLTRDNLYPGQILFTLDRGGTFAVEMARDVVAQSEASAIDGDDYPALFLVTDGQVSVTSETSDVVELSAGAFAELHGKATVTGASREPAAFVVARIGPEVPERVRVRQQTQPTVAPVTPSPAPLPPTAAPAPTSTPIPTPTVAPVAPASVTIASFVCPVAYEGSDYATACIAPASGVEFSVISNERTLLTGVAGENGRVGFPQISPGDYVLGAGVPGDFASSRVRCVDGSGANLASHVAVNQVAISLQPGAVVACDWYIVPDDARGEVPDAASVAISSFICSVGYAGVAYETDCAEPSSGIAFSVEANGEAVQAGEAGPAGGIVFAGLDPGDYLLVAGVPGDFASSRVWCIDPRGDNIARRFATNQVSVTLTPGDDVACTWYIVPEHAAGT